MIEFIEIMFMVFDEAYYKAGMFSDYFIQI